MPALDRTGDTPDAEPLDPDLSPWEQQPKETDVAYRRFRGYLESETRIVADHDNAARTHSRRWSWGFRAAEFDRHVARRDFEEMANYRRKMNDRHRVAARGLQAKVLQWLKDFDEDRVRRMRPETALRMLEVAVQVEREATGIDTSAQQAIMAPTATDGVDDDTVEDESGVPTFADLLGGQPASEAALADAINEVLSRVRQ